MSLASSIATPTSAPPVSRGISFVAPDIGTAIADIRSKLGSDAIILDVRRSPANGLRRFWQKPQIEVVACLPDAVAAGPERLDATSAEPIAPPSGPMRVRLPQQQVLQRYAQTTGGLNGAESVPEPVEEPLATALEEARREEPPAFRGSSSQATWKCAAVFERLGFSALHAEQVILRMREMRGPNSAPPATLTQELVLARDALQQLWRSPAPLVHAPEAPLHVFLGPPGTGKSTALCKWLAQTVLVEGKRARAWRLDGRTTNASELVSLYGEILGVRVERIWQGRTDPAEVGFVDLAGADFQDAEAVDGLGETLARLRGAVVHLVLNAAYTVPLMLAQARAFSRLPVDDVILTHLDEEPAWGKLWNVVLGTKYPISRLGAGQNIPGRFLVARPELLTGSLFGQ